MKKKTFKEVWEMLPTRDKRLTVSVIIISAAIIVLAVLQITNVWDKAINVFEPLLGVLMLLEAALMWNKNRLSAVICLAAAIFIFICGILIAGMRLFARA